DGNMKLGPIDTTAAMASIKSVSDAYAAALNQTSSFSGTGSFSVGAPGSSGAMSGSMFHTARVRRGNMAGSTMAQQIAQQAMEAGGAQNDLDDYFASQGAIYPTAAEKKKRMAAAVEAQKQRDASHKAYVDAEKKARADKEKEQQSTMDQFVARAVQQTNKEKKANLAKMKGGSGADTTGDIERQAAAFGHAATSALYFAKGLALVATSSDEETASMIKTVVAIQGYMDMARGATSLATQLAAAHKASAAASAAGSASGAGGAAGGALAGIGTVASAGFLAAAAAIGTAIAALVAWRTYVIETRRVTESYYDMLIGKSTAAAEATSRGSSIQSRHLARMTAINELISSSGQEARRSLTNISGREATESGARAYEHDMNLSPELKHLHRQRLENSQ